MCIESFCCSGVGGWKHKKNINIRNWVQNSGWLSRTGGCNLCVCARVHLPKNKNRGVRWGQINVQISELIEMDDWECGAIFFGSCSLSKKKKNSRSGELLTTKKRKKNFNFNRNRINVVFIDWVIGKNYDP